MLPLVWQAQGVQQTVLFRDGFAVVAPPVPTSAVRWLPGRGPIGHPGNEYRLHIINTRGELLRVRSSEAAVRQPDGSLLVQPRWQAHGRWELRAIYQLPEEATGVSAHVYQRVHPGNDWPANLPEGAADVRLLGARRVSWSTTNLLRAKPGETRGTSGRYLLADMSGRRLTEARYASVQPFSENRAAFGQRVSPSGGPRGSMRYGFLDTTGREVVAARFDRVSAFRRGRAVVYTNGQAGVIDKQGAYVLAPGIAALSDPDESGFIRQAVSATGQPTGTRYLPPPGRQGFFALTFDEAGPFRHRRAWVRQGARVGLINEAGQFVTPVPYERLVTALRIRSLPKEGEELDRYADRAWNDASVDAEEPGAPRPRPDPVAVLLRPDTAYLIARRQGRYGLVERRSGREVVPAIYDSVVANARRGVLCLRRGRQDYIVIAATGAAMQGRYDGIDFRTPRERLLYVVRESPAAWALLDTLGRLKTPWILGKGYPTVGGWLLTSDASGWNLRDSTGRVGFASPKRIEQPEADAYWATVQASLNEGAQDAEYAPYWQLPLVPFSAQAAGGFYLREPGRVRVLDPRLHEQTTIFLPVDMSVRTEILRSGWVYQVPVTYQAVFEGGWFAPTTLVLYTDAGQPVKLPGQGAWAYIPRFDYSRAWRTHGVLPTTQGYLTRGGRQLWDER
ncbi:WG repeat-containing protein [Hymenobacter sp. BT594]|uniref:WG repeat-containing protein n=1 Tax=Hymenobacter guriensis TaxID=2793065 RepID=A0ABS0KYW1_9BACT|nr:WG repeat-containing protein [Hymenobacter guriensis]